MMKRNFVGTLLALFTCSLIAAGSVTAGALPSNAEVRSILVDRIEAQHQGVGIVVGLIDASGRRVVAYGTFDNDKRNVDGDTLFEIGSTTKVFTSLLLADAVQRGEVSLDDPVAKYLPAEVKVPERGGKKITLVDLATHTSGLPRLPSNMPSKNLSNPYADYTVNQLYEFLSSYELQRDPGSKYEYSNLGAGLLGVALARRAGTDYETLVRTRITRPLSMKSTAITLSEPLRQRLAPGHDSQRKSVSNWDFPAMAGAGALRSTADDLMTFVSANLGQIRSPLAPAMDSMLKTRRPTGMSGLDIALGWHISSKDDRQIVWHNGGTGGYRSFIGFDPKAKTGVVVLANMFTENGVDDIGQHLLDPSVRLAAAPKQRTEIAIDPKTLEGYTGRYELAPNFMVTVTREGNRLFAQATGQPRFEIFAERAREFFFKAVDAQVTFQTDDSGHATGLVLHQNGRDIPGKRLEGDAPPPKERKEISLDGAVLDRYVGRYQLAPNFVIAITREGAHLFLQAMGQSKLQLFAEGEHDFFLKAIDAQVTFSSEGNERATKMVLHQNGMDLPGPRIE
jgi:CubicO group peptidase (beta-lactamase class C family)